MEKNFQRWTAKRKIELVLSLLKAFLNVSSS
jgi:hypothetical protein